MASGSPSDEDFYFPLFQHLSQEHGLTCTETELQAIIETVRRMTKPKPLTQFGPPCPGCGSEFNWHLHKDGELCTCGWPNKRHN